MIKPNTPRLYQFYRLLIVPAILWYVWVAHYAVTAPMGETIVYERWAILLSIFVATPVSIIIGFALMQRLPGNVIGPALIVFAAAMPSEVIFALVIPATQASLNEFSDWVIMLPTLLILLSHYPSGTIYPRRIMPIVYFGLALMLITGFGSLFGASVSYGTNFAYGEALANPFLIEALKPISGIITDLKTPMLITTFLVTLGIFINRYTQSTAIERKQIRWLLFGMVVPTIVILLSVIMNVSRVITTSASLSIVLVSLSFPITIGIGIVFYRLWDIDVIIRRTFTYSIISVILVGSYLLIVLASQSVLSTFIDSESSLVVVISTLGVAVLFNPVRERVQRFIDRLFNRKRYDADATLEAFRDNIRNAIEPEAIQGHLVQAVSSTIQPATISFWGIDRQ